MPAFTRRHYVEVARILHDVRDKRDRQRLAEEFARMFRQDNPAFDVERFSSVVFGEGGHARNPGRAGDYSADDYTRFRDAFTRAYFETALWSTSDDESEPLDENYSVEDIAPETQDAMVSDAENFLRRFGHLIADDTADWDRAGHDFWLTRNRHGAGFWDGDWPKYGDELTKAAEEYGEFDLYVGDDGMIHGG